MPNKSSNKNHIPQRTCVICRSKKAQKDLMRFVFEDGFLYFDLNRRIQSRGYYVCLDKNCILKLDKWIKKKNKWKNKQKKR